jgi:hypothetical protein
VGFIILVEAYMVALAGLTAITLAGLLVLLGLWLDQGWLSVLGMISLAGVMIGVLRLPSPAIPVVEVSTLSPTAPAQQLDLVPVIGLMAVLFAGVIVSVGLLIEWGWIAVIGMGLLGLFIVRNIGSKQN